MKKKIKHQATLSLLMQNIVLKMTTSSSFERWLSNQKHVNFFKHILGVEYNQFL